jgi:hypothetical protein
MKYFLGVLLILFFLVRAISIVARSRTDLTSPGGIAKRLTADRRHVISIPANRYVWNPSHPLGSDNRVHGPGTATYTYADGIVTLDYAPKDGEARHYTGPLPEGLTGPEATPSLIATLAAPVIAIIAAVVAVLLAGGSVGDHITLGALVGLGAWVLTSIVMMATNQTIRTQSFAASRAH